MVGDESPPISLYDRQLDPFETLRKVERKQSPVKTGVSCFCAENDILFAYKALSLVYGPSEAARRVAAAILDHFNKRTGQCDPSVEPLAKMLGIDRATVHYAPFTNLAAGHQLASRAVLQ